jgi:hypothetical protein
VLCPRLAAQSFQPGRQGSFSGRASSVGSVTEETLRESGVNVAVNDYDDL